MIDPEKFAEYKTFIEDTARLSERRQTISNIYIAVNSLLLTAIAFIIKDFGAAAAWKTILPFPLIVAGIFVSLWWRQLLKKYKGLIGLRFGVLREMEDSEKLSGLEKMYHREDVPYPRDKDGNIIKGKGPSFTDLETRLPILFMILNIIFCFILLIAMFLNLMNKFIGCI